MRFFIFFFTLLVATSALAAKNIILFIGDGLGTTTITATRVYFRSARGNLAIDRLPYTAMLKTYASDKVVTDSAAAATALASGVKTKNDVLGEDESAVPGTKDGKSTITVAELAKKAGKAVGLVTTTRITHATPAAFYAHIHHRDLEKQIAEELLHSSFDLFLGGGRKYFDVGRLRKEGEIEVISTAEELATVGKKYGNLPPPHPILGLFHEDHMSYESDRKAKGVTEPSLPEMTEAAIAILSRNPRGFFLMVEGGRIDHAAHTNRIQDLLMETFIFDRAIEQALALTSTKDTLVLVTADHETAGVSLNGYPDHGQDISAYPFLTFVSRPGQKANPTLALPYGEDALHTGTDVPLYASGPGAREVHGTLDNTDLFPIMKKALNFR
ncbi:MAG TPA: alkaline phosphatase [Bdellovibrionota bacterium]|nr:alkaline phosphatase [Bdellovibrionota bacterium]